MNKGTVVILSGGMDSTTLLYKIHRESVTPTVALSFNYGQKHAIELAFAEWSAVRLGLDHHVVDLRSLGVIKGSALVDPKHPVPDGHYTDKVMKETVVPNRNMVMLSLAIAFAISRKFDMVAYGAHAGDHTIYPDCRPEFFKAMAEAAAGCSWDAVKLFAPFLHLSKADIVREGNALGVPFEKTWSCYKGGKRHCGRCGTCVERIEAFQLASVPDPTEYESKP